MMRDAHFYQKMLLMDGTVRAAVIPEISPPNPFQWITISCFQSFASSSLSTALRLVDTIVLDDIFNRKFGTKEGSLGSLFLRNQHLVVGLKPCCFFHCPSHWSYQDHGLRPYPCIDHTGTNTATEQLNYRYGNADFPLD